MAMIEYPFLHALAAQDGKDHARNSVTLRLWELKALEALETMTGKVE